MEEGEAGEILYSIPDENLPTIETRREAGSSEVSTVTRGSAPWQELIASGALSVGSTLHLEYGPRGEAKQSFRGIVRSQGIEVDGQVYSPSYAAVHCIQQAGSDRVTANGWIMWKDDRGVTIRELYERMSVEDSSTPEHGSPT